METKFAGGPDGIEFRDMIKGQITQALLAALLERCGYRVVRLGIEELFREVRFQERERYQVLELPARLRYLPDLLVAPRAEGRALLVEVKFRCRFDDGSARWLREALDKQRAYWPEAYAVLMVAEPPRGRGKFHQDFIRVLPPGDTGALIDLNLEPRARWEGLPPLRKVFSAFTAAHNRALADSTALALRKLAGL